VIPPAWSLDALRVPFQRICMRWSFAPDRIPLSRVHPTTSVAPPLLPWRVNRNSEGQLFHSGGQQYGWGFGVHAYSELRFTLPRYATSFQARLGLDRIADTGGCVKARVFLGSTTERPLYASELLIGSKKTVATGSIAIASPPKGPKRLVLQADTAHRDRPPGTDPLNIRDKLDWLDPVIGLDAAGLRDEVHRKAVEQLRVWQGWTVKFDKRGRYTWTSHLWPVKPLGRDRFQPLIRAEKHPLVFSREITVGPRDNWLVVDTGVFDADGTFCPKAISLRVDSKEIKPERTPMRQDWQERDAAPVFPIGQYRRKKVTLELTQPGRGPALFWHKVGISDPLPREYRLADVLAKAGKADMKVPRGLGWALQSATADDAEGLALLDVHRLGGIVNFSNPLVKRIEPGELGTVLIGSTWTGGDRGFMTLAKVGGLKSLFLAGDAGISAAAVAKLKAQKPDLTVRQFERTPSGLGPPRRHGVRNGYDRDVMVRWVDFEGQLAPPRTVRPNRQLTLGRYSGGRYEAYIDDKLIATYHVPPGPEGPPYLVWEIIPK
jgi:hypothetical protein